VRFKEPQPPAFYTTSISLVARVSRRLTWRVLQMAGEGKSEITTRWAAYFIVKPTAYLDLVSASEGD